MVNPTPPAEVELARVLKSPSPIPSEDKGVNPTYYGSLTLSDNSETNAYIKHISPDEVFTEVICSLICRSIGLPTPKPYIAILDGDATLDSLKENEDPLLFATEDAKRPSFKRLLRESEAVKEAISSMLHEWPHTPTSAVFDEQIGNIDRNTGNILIDLEGECSLIDHGLAFNHSVNPSDIQHYNIFAEITAKRKKPLDQISKALPKLQKVDVDQLIICSQGERYASQQHIERVQMFYNTRLRHIRDIFDLRFGTVSNQSLPL